jgi:tRNA nucleotidyltransferase (CCA-adding enzyme)
MEPLVLGICKAVRDAGGRAILVGGSVRDLLLDLDSKDFDIEVYALSPARLREVLEAIAQVNTVGEQFAVYKLALPRHGDNQAGCQLDLAFGADDAGGAQPDPPIQASYQQRGNFVGITEIDVSIPRRESKSGSGHRGFLIAGDPSMSFEEAARRRDFTVNAIGYDPLSKETIDPVGGVEDLKRRLLRAVSAETFGEDSLRVLRAMQLAARFEMTIEDRTVELCRSIDLLDLPRERVWGEFEKLLIGARKPSIGLQVALDLLILDKLFPAIRALMGCPQNPQIHPEGDVFTHTKLVIDQAAPLAQSLPKPKRIAVMLGTLLHDLGKPLTTGEVEGKISNLDHDEAGVEPAKSVLDTLGLYTLDGYNVRAQVLSLVREHLRPGQLYKDSAHASEGTFRRLARRVDIELLYLAAKADALGRGPSSSAAAEEWFIERAKEIGVEHGPPPPLLQGRHLIEAGFEPGPRMGNTLREIYELQLDGTVTTLEEALVAAGANPKTQSN